jgi:hypothetical protein
MATKNIDIPEIKFKDIQVSTKTFTAMTNLQINIKELFEYLPITPYMVIPKKRGRKKKGEQIVTNQDINWGSIITLKCEGKLRGVELKTQKNKQGRKQKWFRNSITIIIILDKPINFKVCRNGTFQMTGCKSSNHALECIKVTWGLIKDQKQLYSFQTDSYLKCLFIPSMRNIDFSVGFLIDREKLNNFMTKQKQFHCLLETSFGYTGVNIKIPLDKNIENMKIVKLDYVNDDWVKSDGIYKDYLDIISEKEKKQKLECQRYNTFLVFHSGKIIMSGLTSEFMEEIFYFFIKTIINSREFIEEKLIK